MRRGRIALCALLLAAAVAPAARVGGGALTGSPGAPGGPVWVVDPQDPGPHLPPAGRSLFDLLTFREENGTWVQRVPFPFAALLADVEHRLGHRPGDPSPVQRVLIPLGRSLQRSAAEPAFFRFPRAVAAVDGEAASGAPAAGWLLRDRLYFGYQEKAEVLEVLSYNETAGRFEFQLVRDYRPGGAARVTYANRAVCTACHQGGGPLFSRQVWDETNANPQIARRLAAEKRDFYGFPVAVGVEAPRAIDDATDRGNRIALDQLLWQEGCGGAGSWAIRCRAAAFTAALQRALSGGFDAGASDIRDPFLAVARRAAETRWPQGLAVPDPDIPNRDPLASHRPAVRTASLPATLGPDETARLSGLLQSSHVPAELEPLNPRPPLEIWTAAGAGDRGPARLVTGLAAFLSREDVRQLDAALFARGRKAAARERQTLPCTVASRPRGGESGERVKLRCTTPAGLSLEGRIYLEGARVTGGTIEKLDTGGGPLRDLDLTGGAVTVAEGRREIEIVPLQKLTGLHARRTDGNAVESLRITWQGEETALATVTVLADFTLVADAIRALAAQTEEGMSDAFSSRPFRRTAVLGPLFTALGLPREACCPDVPPDHLLPPPHLEAGDTARPEDFPEPAVRAFFQYCGRCHATAEPSPPNFLHGDAPQVRAQLTHCAERIFYRLDAWRLAPGDRTKTPMPPVHALPALGLSAATWPEDPALALLKQHTAGLLRAETGAPPRLEDLEVRGYESLRSCLETGLLP